MRGWASARCVRHSFMFENLGNYNVDYIVVATAAADVQRQRVLNRPGMTDEKFQSILQKQVPDEEKRQKADYLVHTDYSTYHEAKAQVAKVIESIIEKNPALWDQWKSGMHPVTRDGTVPFTFILNSILLHYVY